MNGKKIAMVAVTVLAFGGIITNTTLGVLANNSLKDQLGAATNDYKQSDEELGQLIKQTREELLAKLDAQTKAIKAELNRAKEELEASIGKLSDETAASTAATIARLESELADLEASMDDKLLDEYYTADQIETYVGYFIDEIMELTNDFRGELTVSAKAAGVRFVEQCYLELFDDAMTIYELAAEIGADEDLLNDEMDTLEAIWAYDLALLKEEGKAYILLAPDAETAEELANEYGNQIYLETIGLQYLYYQQSTINTISNTKSSSYKNLTADDLEALKALILAMKFDHANTVGKTVEEKQAYLTDLRSRLSVAQAFAQRVSGLNSTAKSTKTGINNLANLTAEQKEHYTDMVDATYSYSTFATTVGISPLATTTATTSSVTSAYTAVNTALTLIQNKARGYNDVLTSVNTQNTKLGNLTSLSDADREYYANAIAAYGDFGSYVAAIDPLATAAEVTAATNAMKDGLTALGYSATSWDAVSKAVADAYTAIDASVNLSAEEKAAYKAQVAAVETFDKWKADTAEFGKTQKSYTDLAKTITDAIATIVDNALAADQIDQSYLDAVEAINENEGLSNEEKAYFIAVLESGRNAAKDGATKEKADAYATVVTGILSGADTLVEVKETMVETNETIATDVDNFVKAFVEAHNNHFDDGQTVADSYATTIQQTVAANAYTYTLPTIAEGETFETTLTNFGTFIGGISKEAVAATEQATMTALNTDVLPLMVASYEEAEAARLKAEQTKYLALLKTKYDNLVAANPSKADALKAVYDRYVSYINAATKSDDVVGIYNNGCANLDKVVE